MKNALPLDRRHLLEMIGVTAVVAGVPGRVPVLANDGAASAPPEPADYTIRVGTGLVELAPDHIVSTTLYNGQFPGPLIRLKEGQRAVVDIYNDTDVPELVHWHGQMIPSDVDGAAEEGSPFVPARGMQRIVFVPKPQGFRFYHSHVPAGADLNRGTYTGQAGPVYIEPKNDPGAYDQEVFLVMKEFEPAFSRGGDMAMDMLAPGVPIKELQETGAKADEEAKGTPKGYEVGYELFSINGKMLGAGEPIRVKQGERVLFHVLNASATEIRSLALPAHVFRVVALDGNPVPTPADVPVLWLGTAERISAIVEMNHAGVFALGDLSDDDRGHGMGIVVEYSGRSGKPRWVKPKPFRWDYARFGKIASAPAEPDRTIEMLIVKHNAAANGFNLWTLNGEAFSMEKMRPLYKIQEGRRYRLKFRNASDDIHPLHLHRHSFELVRLSGKPTAGVLKDVVMLGGFQEIEFDFVADKPVELDIERKIIGSLLSLLTMPARTRIAADQFAQSELRAADETLRVAAETRRAYVRAVAARQIVVALGEAKANADASAELARQLKQTGAVNKLDQARREVFATELDAGLVSARQQSRSAREKLTRLMGLWHSDLDAYLPSALSPLPGSMRSVRAIEQEALNSRVDVQIARLEMEALARSYGLTRKTHLLNVLAATGISKTQENRGEKSVEGGGYELVLEVPLFDFGKANVREAEQRYLEAANRLGQLGVNATSEAREAYAAYRATYAVARKYEGEVLPLQQTISAETELQYNAMQVDAFVLLETARERARAKVAGIEARRNFWLASTDLSVALLGGALTSEPDAVLATSSGGTTAD